MASNRQGYGSGHVPREELAPTETPINEGPFKGDIRRDHPGYGMIGAVRWVGSGIGSLYGSPIKHRAGVTITIMDSYEQGNNYSWRQSGDKILAQVHLSEAQWASFITAMNVGNGVPCTLSYHRTGDMIQVPAIVEEHPIERRRKMIKDMADKQMADLTKFAQEYDALCNAPGPVSKTRMKELRTLLLHAVDHAAGNFQFQADMVSEHMEETVTAAKSDVEGYILHQAVHFPGLLQAGPELPALEPPKESA